MIKLMFLLAIVRSKNGFLLDIKNSSSVSQTYLTVAEYISDQNKMLDDLARMQDTFRHQQETYHAQQQRTLNLLTTQLQQRFQMIENRYGKNNETKQAMEALERKYMNLERMYTFLKETMNSKDLLYQELAQNYTQMQDVLTNQDTLCKYNYSKIQQEIERIEADCNTQVSMITNKTIAVEHKVGRLEQANSIHQLSLQNLKEEMQHCYSKINILTSHEQAHNQDFLALYNLTKLYRSDIHELANKTNMQLKLLEETHNLSFSSIQQKENQNFHTLYNLSSISIRKINALANQTIRQFGLLERNQNLSFSTFEQNKKHEFRNFTSQIDALGKSTIRRFEILERNQNLSYSTLQKNIEKNGLKGKMCLLLMIYDWPRSSIKIQICCVRLQPIVR